MQSDLAVLFYYTKPNKYSFNALGGALESDIYFENLKFYFVTESMDIERVLRKAVSEVEKMVVGISFSSPQIFEIESLIKNLRIKFKEKNVLFIAGGPHPTADPKGVLDLGFDIVVRGEGEKTFIELLKKLDTNRDCKDVKGLSFTHNSDYIYTGPREKINLNTYPPFPAKHHKFGAIEITRGCPWACRFCQTPFLFGSKVRHRSVSEICKYVKIMKNEKHGKLLDVRFITPNAFSYGSDDGKKVDYLAIETLLSSIREIIKDQGRIFFGTFPSEVRPENVDQRTIDLVLRYADNDNLIIGAQSGSQRILDACRRGHTVEDIYRSVELIIDSGLKANVDFIFGLPSETEEDLEMTLKVMNDLIMIGAKIRGHTFIPLPGTPFEKSVPSKISSEMKRELKILLSKGKLYGDWLKQEKIASKIIHNRLIK
jgi:B12-binding domain/radical SAM domain protein